MYTCRHLHTHTQKREKSFSDWLSHIFHRTKEALGFNSEFFFLIFRWKLWFRNTKIIHKQICDWNTVTDYGFCNWLRPWGWGEVLPSYSLWSLSCQSSLSQNLYFLPFFILVVYVVIFRNRFLAWWYSIKIHLELIETMHSI